MAPEVPSKYPLASYSTHVFRKKSLLEKVRWNSQAAPFSITDSIHYLLTLQKVGSQPKWPCCPKNPWSHHRDTRVPSVETRCAVLRSDDTAVTLSCNPLKLLDSNGKGHSLLSSRKRMKMKSLSCEESLSSCFLRIVLFFNVPLGQFELTSVRNNIYMYACSQ